MVKLSNQASKNILLSEYSHNSVHHSNQCLHVPAIQNGAILLYNNVILKKKKKICYLCEHTNAQYIFTYI